MPPKTHSPVISAAPYKKNRIYLFQAEACKCSERQEGQDYSPRWPLRPAHAPGADLIIAFAMGQNFAFGWDQVRLGLSGALGDTHCSKTPLSRVVPLQRYNVVLVFDLVVNAF